jgi:hypothetical protein
MVEEDNEKKRTLVKITRATGIRQLINYVLAKVRDDWVIEMNAFTVEIGKVL